jgi:hypothetical protein
LGERLDRTQEVAGSSPASSIARGPRSTQFGRFSFRGLGAGAASTPSIPDTSAGGRGPRSSTRPRDHRRLCPTSGSDAASGHRDRRGGAALWPLISAPRPTSTLLVALWRSPATRADPERRLLDYLARLPRTGLAAGALAVLVYEPGVELDEISTQLVAAGDAFQLQTRWLDLLAPTQPEAAGLPRPRCANSKARPERSWLSRRLLPRFTGARDAVRFRGALRELQVRERHDVDGVV